MLEEWKRSQDKEQEKADFDWRKKGKYVVVILVCLGLLALIWPANKMDQSKIPDSVPGEVSAGSSNSVSEQMELEMESILAQIEGAGQVEVSISLSSEGSKTYATNLREEKRETREEDSRGNNKVSVDQSITRDLAVSSGEPLLVEEKRPEVLGVLVVAEGADLPDIKEKLTDAAATLLDIPSHRVRVMSREGDD